ncbi:MAG: ROK family glucokinase [Candidatus Nanopelagicales bacterium]
MTLHIGIDVGGTKIAAGLVNESGEIVRDLRVDTPRTSTVEILDVLCNVILELKKEAPSANVCVAVPGFVSKTNDVVLITPNLPLRNLNLREEVNNRIGEQITVENDANAAAWGEYLFGAAQGFENVVMLTIGTGLGGGLVLHHQLFRGSLGLAAEVGHMTITPDGLLCGCGQHGCWEQYASGNALVRTARELASATPDAAGLLLSIGDGSIDGIQGHHITKAALIGCDVALRSYQELGKWLGQGIANLTALLDPDIFVLGGGVADAGNALLLPAIDSLNSHLTAKNFRSTPEVRVARLGNEAGIVGASALARG